MFSDFKKIIPARVKLIPWFLFSSPQRALGFFITYRTDILGFTSLLAKSILKTFGREELQAVSLCTGLSNRSANYLNFVLESVLKMENKELIELSVFDCNSNDIPELEKKIREKWKGKLIFTSERCDFSRSYTFNRAIGQASNELVFAVDADMTLPKNLVAQCNKYVSKKSVWFPICFHLRENKPAVINEENGYWRSSGLGMFAAYKWQFTAVGKYDEKYKSWGKEDYDLWRRFYLKGFLPVRNRCRGLFHNYHPDLFETDPRDKKLLIQNKNRV